MKIISIDRTPYNHGKYTATINLNYDEACIIKNIFYYHAKTNKSIDEKILEDQWKIMSNILCHGMLDNFSIKHLNAVKHDTEDQAAKMEVADETI